MVGRIPFGSVFVRTSAHTDRVDKHDQGIVSLFHYGPGPSYASIFSFSLRRPLPADGDAGHPFTLARPLPSQPTLCAR